MVGDREILEALRGEVTVAALCGAAGINESEFQTERDSFFRRRLPPSDLQLSGGVRDRVEIRRDGRGAPHLYAQSTEDLYLGLGLAMAQDRLWQMDLFRRRGRGTLAEILGPAYLSSDVTHRTLDLDRIAQTESTKLDPPTAAILQSFVTGINLWIETVGKRLPIEFSILDYEPAPWTETDVIVALRGFWWSLNGRLQSIVAAEAAGLLPAGALRDAYLTPYLPDERILPGDATYPAVAPTLSGAQHSSVLAGGSDDGASGSNNWAVGRERTASGASILASDPHQFFALPANWYEYQLVGPEDDVAGAGWAGAPGIWFGRNRRIAWGLTNNGVSLRDLYIEEIDPRDAGRYRDGDSWRPFDVRTIEIPVRGQASHSLNLRWTTHGPIVNELIPSIRPDGDPLLSLRWVGQEHVDDVKALLSIGRAKNWTEFRAALRDWAIPTFNWVFGDVDGNVGYQCASRLPIRGRLHRGFRDAGNPADQWQGYVPFEGQPSSYNPARGFTSSANNAPVRDDYPIPYPGSHASGERAIRIRETIEQTTIFDVGAAAALQNDTLSVQARRLVPLLVLHLAGASQADAALLGHHLAAWDYRYEVTSIAPSCFEMFLRVWKSRIALERFPKHLATIVTGQGQTHARLIEGDDLPWFAAGRIAMIRECAALAVEDLRSRFGPDEAGWTWGRVHQLRLRHPLSGSTCGLGLDVGPVPISGSSSTVRNTGLGANPLFSADSGAEYRLIVDLADPTRLWSTLNLGQSGQPGSPFYQDQFADFVEGRYHVLPLERAAVEAERTASVTIQPV